MEKRHVKASVKDERLVAKRRNQMVQGAVQLFKEKGFHRTTTREIARAAGFSTGTLYEYIQTKDDVLYLVCDEIYDRVHKRCEEAIQTDLGTREQLEAAIDAYFRVMDDLQDEVLVMYQEVKSLTKDTLPYVLNKELEMVDLFEQLLERCCEEGVITLSAGERKLAAHQLFVQGQMWAFRRWVLRKHYTLSQYIDFGKKLLLDGVWQATHTENKTPTSSS
ncbi:TetR/AcrR family transcriptional regulator [Bacillus fonticola]|uniref:TetR/AcrR family transcriptional regulator n=1 Tax=Bacillus fonticola TaxID=2728853 RepID=UPI0014730C12|nr:TetR/AcrR family transcriptional regulator [Bacillus fonticola]